MPELITKKVALIKDYLQQLDGYLLECASEKRPPDSVILSIERLFQLIVDESVDVNALILEQSGRPLPDTNQATFQALADTGVIPQDIFVKIAGSVGLRNRLVHRYETVQPGLLLREVPKYATAYKEYLAIIVKKFLV